MSHDLDVLIGGAEQKENVGIWLNETPGCGNYCKLYPRLDPPKVYAVGAVVEVFAAGSLDLPEVRPLLTAAARTDARPIHVGLGGRTHFDLRVTFPGQELQQWSNMAAHPKIVITRHGPE